MNQEQNSPPDAGSGTGAQAHGESQGQEKTNRPAADASSKRRSRRSTSAPTRLKQAAQLLHTAPAVPQPAVAKPSGDGSATGASAPADEAGALPQTAAEDDPRAWGDSPEDGSAWLLEQRPPHWG
ncbi:hypothetical protein ACQ7FX_10770 [Arthrobacter koreensis]|uniref:hypothetical protein n=1 Tax=Arthrobacter koreensis TaxID=199136 RepID=UPI003D90FCE2